MRSSVQRSGSDGRAVTPRTGRGNNGIIPSSFKAISSYLRIVSSGASTVASTVKTAASAFVDRDSDTALEQVSWAGFDRLELERGITRQVLLLGYSHGFQVWDVEEADNVHNLVSRNDGPVSFMQISPIPLVSNQNEDTFTESRPLLIICADGSFSGPNTSQNKSVIPFNAPVQQCNGAVNGSCLPTLVWFYSLRFHSYVHLLRFRSVVYLVRCSSKVVAILQSNQIHCFNAAKLEREYIILTNPVVAGCYGAGNMGFGPLALGPRWIAYSGTQVSMSDSDYVSPQHIDSPVSFTNSSLNGSLVAHYAKESSKQIASGFATLGDIGYKKLSKYWSEWLSEGSTYQSGAASVYFNSAIEHMQDAGNVGVVIVRDIISKTLIAQFMAHKSPISSLCFDPSGTLLVTASIQGHNINVFRIIPGHSKGSPRCDHGLSYVHLYKLQRGLTNAVIQDISFSADSQWIMVSSSRGTSHLFSLSPFMDCSVSSDPCFSGRVRQSLVNESADLGLEVVNERSSCAPGSPVSLSAVSRIRNGNNSWRNTVSGVGGATTAGGSYLSGAISSVFHNCKRNDTNADANTSMKHHYLLIFSPTGNMIQYALRLSPLYSGMTVFPGARSSFESGLDCDDRLVVEAIQKWSICQKHNRKEREDNMDFYGEIGNSGSSKVYPERKKLENSLLSDGMLTNKKNKVGTAERQHIYLSEVELQMHRRKPLWMRSEIYFQSMMLDDYNMDKDCSSNEETAIEKIPIRMLEERSNNLIPLFDHLQAPRSQHERIPVMVHVNNGQLQQYQDSDHSKFPYESRSDPLDHTTNSRVVGSQLDRGSSETEQIAPHTYTKASSGFMHTNNIPLVNILPDTVNTENFL